MTAVLVAAVLATGPITAADTWTYTSRCLERPKSGAGSSGSRNTPMPVGNLLAMPVAVAMTEAELTAAVIDEASWRGWKVHHCRPARTATGWRTPLQGHVGFPDLVLARRGVVLFIELKSARGRVHPSQAEWLEAVHGYIWRPADWTSGRIDEALR